MDTTLICLVKGNLVPRIVDVLLGNGLQFRQFAFLNEVLDFRLCFQLVPCSWIVRFCHWTVAIPANVLDVLRSAQVLPTKQVPFLGVAFDIRHK